MSRLQFGQGGCEKTRKYLDAYVSNELLVETNYDIVRHLGDCPSCAAEAESRTRLRNRLKAAVNAQAVPPELQARIRQRIGASESRRWLKAGWTHWAISMAATAPIGVGLWVNFSTGRLPALSDRPAQNTYIARVSAKLAAVLKVGLGDHIHCSIFRKYPKQAPPIERWKPAWARRMPDCFRSCERPYRKVTR